MDNQQVLDIFNNLYDIRATARMNQDDEVFDLADRAMIAVEEISLILEARA